MAGKGRSLLKDLTEEVQKEVIVKDRRLDVLVSFCGEKGFE